MVPLIVFAVMQAATQSPPEPAYSSRAVQQMVERASALNRRVPDALTGYQARVESEMSFIARQADGSEATFSVEQTASLVRWDRGGDFEQRVVGYRTQSVGFTMSAVGLFRVPWAIPVLYGNRLTLLFGQPDTARRGPRRRRQTASIAVHPFAEDRETVYRFSGGDTVVTLRPGTREIPIVRIHVEPHGGRLTRNTMVFRGDVELDAQRAQIVRMRGYLVTVGPKPIARTRFLASQLEAVAYVELENGEFDQQFWLPTFQRVEAQAGLVALGEQRGVFRVVSRFRDMSINARRQLAAGPSEPLDDTLGVTVRRLTFAPADSIDGFGNWSQSLGELSANAHADDFADIAPDPWRPTGRPLVRLSYQSASDLFHYDRIEGAYTGIAGEAKLRDAGPGIVAHANAGWAWAEQTVRGRISIERQIGALGPSLRAGRSLDITNDFREPFDSGSTVGALFSVDDYDYVDRRSVIAGLTFFPTRQRDVRLRVEGGLGSDHYARVRRDRGAFARGDSGFRFNRGVDDGAYRIASATLEFHPDVNSAFVRPGAGASMRAEVASGDLTWRRAEVRLVVRRMLWRMVYAARADFGVVSGDSIPPQQLFELGEGQNLPGYGYKEFAGNQAAVIRGLVMYPLPLWRAPLRLGRWLLPSVSPLVSFGVQGGWASATNAAARASILRLGTTEDSVLARPVGGSTGTPVSRPTDGFKSSIDFRLRFFGGALSAGMARAIDHRDAWRFVLGLAQVL
jgi:hypothetical protein